MPTQERPFVGGVLVAHEKGGDYYYHCPTQEALDAAALQLLTERFLAGYWYLKPEELGIKQPEPVDAETEKAIRAIPDEAIRKNALAEFQAKKRSSLEYTKAAEDYQRIERAVKEKNGREAWQCLRDRRKHEYEDVHLERYQEITVTS